MTVDSAFKALAATSRQVDPSGKGVQFVIQPEADASSRPITLQLNKVPLGVALNYVCELGRLRYRIDEGTISIIPLYGECGMDSRTFHVDPSFVAAPAKTGEIPPVKTP